MDELYGMIKLKSLNYSTWKRIMEYLHYCKDLYKANRLRKKKPSDMDDENWDVQHKKAIYYIRQWMDTNLHEHI